MRAALLAGGFGTRMRPLTATRPKHLLPIANRPHIEHVFDLLQRHDVDEVVLTTSYLADSFNQTIEDARERGITVKVAHEEVALGTGGALRNAAALLGQGTFLAMNADVLTDADLTAMIAFHVERRAELSILLREVDDPSAFGVVPIDAQGRVSGFVEKPAPGTAPSRLINAGVYVMEPSVLERIGEGEVSAERELFPLMIQDSAAVFGYPTDAYWLDVGTPDKYLKANVDALTGVFGAGDRVGGRGDVLTGAGTRVSESAQLSSACIGPGCSIEDGAVVHGSVLLARVVLGAGARVIDSILGEGVIVAPGAEVTGVTAGDGERLG